MEQDVDQGYRTVCTTCLSSDRDLFDLSSIPQAHEIFRLLMYDFPGDRLDMPEITHLTCWECLAMLRKVQKFKWQVHNAQEHLRVLALSQTQEIADHTYLSQTLSSLTIETKVDYDKIFFDYSSIPDETQYISLSTAHGVKSEHFELQNVADNISLGIDNVLEVPEIVLDSTQSCIPSHIVVDPTSLAPGTVVKTEGRLPTITIQPMTLSKERNIIMLQAKKEKISTPGYITEHMTEAEMLDTREMEKKKVQYASSAYKCELCIIGFYTQQQVEDHFEQAHKAAPGLVPCKVCYIYIEEKRLNSHLNQHHLRYICKLCSHIEYSNRLIQLHVKSHMNKALPSAVIQIEGHEPRTKKNKKKKKEAFSEPPKPGDLRKLLSKTTIEGYKCLECDMFFKNSRARKNHVARYHREGLQCDHCKKRFVNKGTLTTHLRLHEGPLPREECPICHKLVRVIQLKYHIKRHQNKSRYECKDCNKIFSHLATYHAHLKYSRAHATEQVLKFPCPMCNKGYPTKEAMQDHFNYQHLGKTAHKCPICEKPIASRSNVDKHIARVHGEKKPKPRNHVCQTCGKPFTDKKALTQHEAIHSGARPLVCDICQQTFKQKASLYTHRKRVHKVVPPKKEVHYMDKPISELVSE